MDKCSDYNKFSILCQSCDYPNHISCSKKAPIKLSQIPAFQLLYIERDKYSDPEIMDKNDFMNSDYFLNKEVVDVKVFIANPENATLDLYDWIEWLGEDMYEGWIKNVYIDLADNPITEQFIQLANKVFENHPTYYPGRPIEIDIPSPRCGSSYFNTIPIKNLCNECQHKDVFWENSGCNLKHGMEPCNFEPKGEIK